MKSLQLKTKLLYLLLSVGTGLVVIGSIGYINLVTMKKNVDTLYFGSLIPLNELNTLNTAYHHDLEVSIYRWQAGLMSNDELAQKITIGLEHSREAWSNYAAHHKRPEELPYVNYAEEQVDILEDYFEEIRLLIGDPTQQATISLSTLADNITSIHTTLSGLIKYEIAAAKYERSILLAHHENSLMQLAVMLSAILLGVMAFAWRIFTQIEIQQQQLLESSHALKLMNTKLERASYTDSLTGIFNRRYFNLVYDREFKRAVRAKQPITFMMIDIDFFKQYNDLYGHLQGDIALKNVAHALKASLNRPGDFAFRLGGEEFGVILSDTDSMSSRKIGEKIRLNIEQLGMEHKGSKANSVVTISIGAICVTPVEGMNNEALLHSSDLNLYIAKDKGRNQIILTSTL